MTAAAPDLGPPRRSGRARPGPDAVLVVLAAVLAAVLALVLAPLGTNVLYVLGGLIVAGVGLWLLRAELGPPLREAVDRVRPSRSRRTHAPRSARAQVVGAAVAVVVVALLAFGLAQLGSKVFYALGLGLGLGIAVWLCWPLLRDLVTAPPTDLASHADGDRLRVRRVRRDRRWGSRGVIVVGVVVAVALLSFVLGALGAKTLLAVAAALVVVGGVVWARDRTGFATFLSVASLTIVLHKSFTTQDLSQSGGAISVYVTTFDAMVVVLYVLWIREGTIVADLRDAFRSRVLWVPLVGAATMLPSLLVAPAPEDAAAELFRMLWMYLLFLYIAARVRSRRQVWIILAGLATFVVIEFVIVILQWRTGGVLGLSFLGVPTTLTQRVTDVSTLGRPFGTIIHPVFMGAVMGTLGLVSLSLAIHLPRSVTKLVAAAMAVACVIPLYLSHTRASALAAVIAAFYVVGVGLARGRLQWRTIGRFAIGTVVAVLVFFPQLSTKFSQDFGTSHFWEEISSRLQLNGIAFNMIYDHWGLGVGLNNFETVLPRYEPHFVIFFGNPVHNLYLLYWSETGVIGLAGFTLVALAMLRIAVLAARSRDPLRGGIAVGIVGGMGFLGLEELLGFSLRQDIPLAVYWLLAGLAFAVLRMEAADPSAPPGTGRARPVPRPPVDPAAERRRFHPSQVRIVPLRLRGQAHRVAQAPGAVVAVVRVTARRSLARWRRRVAAAGRSVTGNLQQERGNRRRGRALLATVAVVLVPVSIQVVATPVTASAGSAPLITFAATVRATGEDALFTAHEDGTDVRRVTPSDGRVYRWARWAFDDTRIVYSVQRPDSDATSIEMVNPDGSGRLVLASFDFVVGQPLVDPTGRWMLFTGSAPWFPRVAIFRLDLATLESVNLTAVSTPLAGLDADPVLTPDATGIFLIGGQGDGAHVVRIDADGSNRTSVTHDAWWNTDPAVSPDGGQIAISSYRGPGTPDQGGGIARTEDFHIVTQDLATGAQRVLTAGANCVLRSSTAPCTVPDMSGYLPRYIDGGASIAFTGALDGHTTCICAIGVDGSSPRVVLASTDLALRWYDFPHPDQGRGGVALIGSAARPSRVLTVVRPAAGGTAQLVDASPDLMHRTVIPLPPGLDPQQARWSRDRSQIVFTARVPVPATPTAPHPPAPPGAVRRDHTTLTQVDPVTLAHQADAVAAQPPDFAAEQVFLRSSDGSVRQLTDPWIEDWRDGVAPGDARANTSPSFSADGSAVFVTNTSTTTGESFLLRIDLRSGAVTNLTNATSGAVAVDDASPAVSPDGSRVAFTWTHGDYQDVYTMDAATGDDVREVTVTDDPDASPAWLPDGSAVISASTRAAGTLIVRTDLAGRETVLSSTTQSPAADPGVVPEGDRVLFLGPADQNFEVYAVPPTGGPPRLLQPDPVDNFLSVDSR